MKRPKVTSQAADSRTCQDLSHKKNIKIMQDFRFSWQWRFQFFWVMALCSFVVGFQRSIVPRSSWCPTTKLHSVTT